MSENLEALIKWAKDSGAVVHESVQWQHSDNKGISAIYDASKHYTPNEELLQVPESLTITPSLAESVFGKDVVPSGNRNALTQLLLAKLKFDTEDTSANQINLSIFFKPYLDILPTGKQIGSPLFWDGDERALISGTDLYTRLPRETRTILETWHSIVTKVPESHRPSTYKEDLSFFNAAKEGRSEHFAAYLNNPIGWTSFPAFLWAHATFTSRGFPYFLGSKEARDMNEAILLPIFDLLNHDNNAQVKWDSKGKDTKTYTFKTEQPLKDGEEIYNSYGPKTNEELLLGYGFALENNEAEHSALVLRIPVEQVQSAVKFGVETTSHELSFTLKKDNFLPDNLVKLFTFLVKTESESTVTLRNKLEGLRQLSKIISQKLEALKPSKSSGSISSYIVKASKIYKNSQKQIFQLTFEEITKVEKSLVKQYKPLSFKTIYKNDKTFANTLLLIFGISSYEQLNKSDDVDRAVLLWVIRCGNKKQYAEKSVLPEWICQRYQSIAQKIQVTKEDVQDNLAIHKALFPNIQQKIPEVYGKGDWSIKSFIIAERFIDEVCFTREASKEVFFVEDVRLDLN